MLGDGLSEEWGAGELTQDVATSVATVLNDWADVIVSGQAFDDAPEMAVESVTKMVEMPGCEFGEDGNGLSDSSDEDEADRHGFVHREDYGPIVDLNAGYFSSHSSLEDDAEYVPNEGEDEFDSENEGHYAYDDEELTVVKARNEWEMAIEKKSEEEFNSLMRLTKNVFEKEENERINDPDPTVRVGELVEGMEWASMNEARACFKKYAIERNFTYKQVKNDKKRMRLVCKDVTCGWKLLASTKADKVTVKLRTVSGVHTCQADGKNKNLHAKAPWVMQELEEFVRAHPNFTPRNIIDEVFRLYGKDISYGTAWIARTKLLEKINGNYEVGYMLVSELCRQIIKNNPGGVARWFRDEETGEFEGFFLAYKASLDGFVNGCRPVVGLDGAHLNGKYGGYCLSAMGMDAMNGLFPIAIYICNGETKQTWSMMLGLLEQYLRKHKEVLTFISDRQKGLIPAVHEIYPEANHRYCFQHMYTNFKKIHKGDMLRRLSWGASKAYKRNEFDRIVEILERDHEAAKDWLFKEPRKHWAKSFFDHTSKCDAVTNNFSESFNAWMVKMRGDPLVQFVDKYSLSLVHMVYERRMASREMGEGLVPYVVHIIEKLATKYNRYRIQGVSDNIFCAINQKSKKKFNVDLTAHKCACNVWQLTGLPCVHACAVIRPRREPWKMYCSPYYTVASFKATYEGIIVPIENEEDWGKVHPEEQVLPPPRIVQSGRPKKLRIRDEDEPEIGAGSRRCKKCKGTDHNARTCDRRKAGTLAQEKKAKRDARKAAKKANNGQTNVQEPRANGSGRGSSSGGSSRGGGKGTRGGGRGSRGGRSRGRGV